MTKKTKIIILISVLVLALLAGGTYFYIRYSNDQKALKANEDRGKRLDEDKTADTNKTSATEEASAPSASTSTNNSSQTTSNATSTSEWLTYSNYAIKYLIQYPKDAKVENIPIDDASTATDVKDSMCVKISTENYYVLIGKKPTNTDPVGCLRTGVGEGWINGPSDTVTAAGMEYTANGMHTESASAGTYEDFFMISPADNRVGIEYGTSVNEKYGTVTKAQAKELVHSIVATYNPAE